MMFAALRSLWVGALALVVVLPVAASAQGSAIAGVVSDGTGGVLPGVTVEASSPALIEGSRIAVTDGQGLYRVIDLRPGVYSVSFTLPGFGGVLREAIALTSGFTATVDVELSVGGVEETITVTGESPVVDVQNVVQREIITAEALATLPVSKSLESMVAIVPGLKVNAANRDTGGSSGDRPSATTIHGSRSGDQHIFYDGLRTNNINSSAGSTGGGGGFSIYFNPATIAEINMEMGQQSISSETGGVTINVIPREGGDDFSGTFLINGTNENFQGDNLSDDLLAQGLTTVPRIKGIFDVNAGVGGPIAENRVWFFGAYRRWGAESFVPGDRFFSRAPLSFTPNPDETRQAYDQNLADDISGRLTYQATDNNKLSLAVTKQTRCLCYFGVTGNTSPEASWFVNDRSHYWQSKWSHTATSRLLLQAGVSNNKMNWNFGPQPGVGPEVISIQELSTGLRYRAPVQFSGRGQEFGFNSSTYHFNFSANYVTGSHSFFVGTNVMHARPTTDWQVNGDRSYSFFNGVPTGVLLRATPQSLKNRVNDIGIYASDQWTLDRMTLNLGVRYTGFRGHVPEQSLPAGEFVPARVYAAVPDVASWHDITPRIGIAYDLFGDAKTALKASVSRFLIGHAGDIVNSENPQTTISDNAFRSWTDANGNFSPDCDLVAPDANGECGPISDRNFGQIRQRTTFRDRDTQVGWGTRDYNWEFAGGIQHELTAGMSVEASYFRRWFGGFLVTDNQSVSPADYDPFCITAPVDSRLPGGGGDEICGLYDINPAAFGLVENLVTFADRFGSQTEVYDGVDLTLNARLARGAFVQGGVNIGRATLNDCEVRPDSPETRFCDVRPPFLPDFKLAVSYPVPFWDLQVSAAIQSSPGPEITASHTVPSAAVAASLGRPLASGNTISVQLVEPGTLYASRLNQVDFRLSKTMRVNQYRFQAMIDFYNLFNASSILTLNTSYGPNWQQPFLILPGRFMKVGVQMNF